MYGGDLFEEVERYAEVAAGIAASDPWLLECWRWLGTSDHCYYMSTKRCADSEVHRYFSPHESPYDAFVSFMNVMTDLERRCGTVAAGAPLGAGEMAVAV